MSSSTNLPSGDSLPVPSSTGSLAGAGIPHSLLERVRELVEERYGFWIKEGWMKQFARQVAQRVEALHLNHAQDYLKTLDVAGSGEAECQTLMEMLCNHETCFARTAPHFRILAEDVLPLILKQGTHHKIRVASLGCATGEEPYSIGITLLDALPEKDWGRVEISALDVSRKALAYAQAGTYAPFQLRELTERQRNRWFLPDGNQWTVRPVLRQRVRFLQHNLMRPLPLSAIDVIFCRNVLIYFRPNTINQMFVEFHQALNRAGWLFLGHSESGLSYPDLFYPVWADDSVYYQKQTLSPAGSAALA